MTCIVAIDPGITGALAFHMSDQPHLIGTYDMPIVDGNVDPHALRDLIQSWSPNLAIIERVSPMPKEGVSSVWRFSAAFTTACVVVKLLNIPLTLVPPTQWKRVMNLKGGKEGKGQARARAIEAFPHAAKRFSRVKDHGRAEAALLAIYAHDKLRRDAFDADRIPPPLTEQP